MTIPITAAKEAILKQDQCFKTFHCTPMASVGGKLILPDKSMQNACVEEAIPLYDSKKCI